MKISNPRLLALGSFLALSLFATPHSYAIDTGVEIGETEFPGVFGLRSDAGIRSASGMTSNEEICTAFLVHPRLLLTAAHCLQTASKVISIGNGTDLFSGKNRGIQPRIERFDAHPEFSIPVPGSTNQQIQKSISSDIAFIALREELTEVTPLSIHVSDDQLSMRMLDGLDATLVGYGADQWRLNGDYQNARIGIKRMGKKKIGMIYSSGAFLLYEQEFGSLPGDSGGPIMAMLDGETYVVGLNHGLSLKRRPTYRTKKNGEKAQTGEEIYYEATVGSLLTKKNLCWVEKTSGIDLPAVDCSTL